MREIFTTSADEKERVPMPVRQVIVKQIGHSEQLQIDVCQWNPVTGEIVHETMEEMNELIEQGFQVADSRTMEMQLRMLAASNIRQYFAPEVWSMVVSILDILAGRTSVDLVVQRWEAAKEETAELEATRLRAMEEQQLAELQSRFYCNDEEHRYDCSSEER